LDFEVNRRAESEIQALSRKVHALTDLVGDIDDRLRGPNDARRDDDLLS
jgi:uncharacterized membrane protein